MIVRTVLGGILFPKVVWYGEVNDGPDGPKLQNKAIGREGDAAASFSTIQYTFGQDAELEFVASGTKKTGEDGDPDEEEPTAYSVWKALPVHPSMAALFLQGMICRKAVALVAALYGIVPPEERVGMETICALKTFHCGHHRD